MNLPKISRSEDFMQTNGLADKDLQGIYFAGGSNCPLPLDCINKHIFISGL